MFLCVILVVALFLESSARNLMTYCTLRTPAADSSCPAGERIERNSAILALASRMELALIHRAYVRSSPSSATGSSLKVRT